MQGPGWLLTQSSRIGISLALCQEAPAPRSNARLVRTRHTGGPKARPPECCSRRGCGGQARCQRRCCQGRKPVVRSHCYFSGRSRRLGSKARPPRRDCFHPPAGSRCAIALATTRSHVDSVRLASARGRGGARRGQPHVISYRPGRLGVESAGSDGATASFRPQDLDLRFGRIHVAVLDCASGREFGVERARMGVPTRAHVLDQCCVASV